MIRRLLLSFVLVLLAGCSSVKVEDFAAEKPSRLRTTPQASITPLK